VSATRNRRLNISKTVEERSLDIEVEPAIADLDADYLEAYVLHFLSDGEVQARIRRQLQTVIRNELAKLSSLFRDALREWIRKEKQKQGRVLPSAADRAEWQKQVAENQRLEKELKTARREMELKAHENQILLKALEKMLRSQSKNPSS
jgi:hypothetical protein